MKDQKPAGYRGALVDRPEHGYMMITITVSVASNEYTHVISHACGLPISEEAEHIEGIDLYHFAVPYGTRIQLTIITLKGVEELWYTVSSHTVLGLVSPIQMSLVRARDSSI